MNHSSGKRGQTAERFDDSVDASLTPLDDEQPADAPGDDDAAAAALRLDMLGAHGDGSLEPPKRSLVGSQNALLLVVVLAAGGALFAMRFLGMGPKSALAGWSVKMPQYDVDKPRDPNNSDHKKVIAELSESRITAQVPTELVQRNPFEMEGVLKTAVQKPGPTGMTPEQIAAQKAEEERKRAEARARDIQAELVTFNVASVLIGAVPVARINGELVRVGDRLGEFFVVKDIHGRGVVLEADGKPYTLDVPERGSTGPHKTPAPRK